MFKDPNAALWWVIGGAAVMLTVVLNVPFLCKLLHFIRLHPTGILPCTAEGGLSIAWFELKKLLKLNLA